MPLESDDLDFTSQKLTAGDVDDITGQINSTTKSLNLCDNNLGDAGVWALLQYLTQKSIAIKYIDLSNNAITDQGAGYIADALKGQLGKQLKNLVLKANNITDDGAKALLRSLPDNTTLRELHLNMNDELSDEMLEAVEERFTRDELLGAFFR